MAASSSMDFPSDVGTLSCYQPILAVTSLCPFSSLQNALHSRIIKDFFSWHTRGLVLDSPVSLDLTSGLCPYGG